MLEPGRVLRPSVAADRNGAGVHRPRPRALEVRAVRAGGGAAGARHRGRGGLRGPDDAQAPDPHRAHRPRPARRRDHAGVGDHAPGRVLRAADEPVRSAVRAARTHGGASALLVELGDGELGIVTDAEIRARVAADGVSLDAPLRAIARSPVPTVPVGQLAVEATVDMLAAGVEHMAVLDGGRVCGHPVGRRPAGPRRPRPDRPAPHDPRRPRRGRARARRLAPARSCSWRCRGPGCRRATSAGCSACSTTRWWRGWSTSRSGGTARRRCRGRGWISAAPPGASSRSPPTRTTRWPTPIRRHRATRPRRRLLRPARRGRQRRPGAVRDRGRQQRRAGRQPALADVQGRTGCGRSTECLRAARRVAPDPGHGGVRLPARGRRTGARRRAHGADPRRPRAPAVHAADGARRPAGFPVALGFRGQLATERDGEHAGRLDLKQRRRSSRWSTWSATTPWPPG